MATQDWASSAKGVCLSQLFFLPFFFIFCFVFLGLPCRLVGIYYSSGSASEMRVADRADSLPCGDVSYCIIKVGLRLTSDQTERDAGESPPPPLRFVDVPTQCWQGSPIALWISGPTPRSRARSCDRTSSMLDNIGISAPGCPLPRCFYPSTWPYYYYPVLSLWPPPQKKKKAFSVAPRRHARLIKKKI